MQSTTYKKWILYADVAATREAYQNVGYSGAEDCGCSHCLNFVAVRNRVYPAEIMVLFRELGVDYTKEQEVCQLTKLDSGLHLYNGWFNFIGRFTGINSKVQVESLSDTQINKVEFEPVTEHFQIDFTTEARCYWQLFEREALVQIEFTVEIPWVLRDKEEPS